MRRRTGDYSMSNASHITAINGNLITVEFDGDLRQGEVGYARLGEARLKAEVVRLRGKLADLQVFESTAGLRVGAPVEFTGELLSVELGPGLLGELFDGLQNPLHRLAQQHGFFLPRGVYLPALAEERRWAFQPSVRVGDFVDAGDALGTVPEGAFHHGVMAPFDLRGRWQIVEITAEGTYRVRDTIGVVASPEGERLSLSMSFRWPVKRAIRLYRERLAPNEPLTTQIRIIDSMFPVARGGTYCIPGPFGSGKTVLHQLTSRFAEVDIVIVAACGERAAEVVDMIRDLPQTIDPRTGRSLMERTIIICNTSSMPIAARESSIYTAVTIGEYYRQMGRDVLLLADSTSRWAQALRERSGRLEEIPGEEAFPAYLESTIADFYERAGRVRLKDGRIASLTIGGSVSPAGGNFEEPVTQATLKAVGAFHGLSRERADARRYPAIDPLDSWSRYDGIITTARRKRMRLLLARAHEIGQMMKVVGDEGTSLEDYVLNLKGEFFDAVYLQQNAFDDVDAATPPNRQQLMFTLLEEILQSPLTLQDRDAGHDFFNQLRLACLDLNSAAWDSADFNTHLARVRELFARHRAPEAFHTGAVTVNIAAIEPNLDAAARRSKRLLFDSQSNLQLTTDNEDEKDRD
jgi:V/A-type H+-transporting ATPase subunit A